MGSMKRYDIRVMIDASAFLDHLRLCSARLDDAIEEDGIFASREINFVRYTLGDIVKEIEDGYATLLRPQVGAKATPGVGS